MTLTARTSPNTDASSRGTPDPARADLARPDLARPDPARPAPACPAGWQPTRQDAIRIAAALAATHSEATRTVYAFAWSRWVSWCEGRGITALPAHPTAICAYLTERAEQGLSLATLDAACSAIGHQHRLADIANPVEGDQVRYVRRGLRRTLGTAPRRPAHPLGVTDLHQIIRDIDPATPRGVRDAAIILLGFAGALRRSELAALTLADLEAKPAGILLHLRRSKTDPHGSGQVVGIAPGRDPLTDPIGALDAWLSRRGHAPGPVFTGLRGGGAPLRPISGRTVSDLVKERAAAAGLSADRISGHSLRAGHATAAAFAGVSVERIAAQTRHRRIDLLVERYIRPVNALETTSSRDLGL